MSLIGTLEHIPLSSVLLGLETHTKTGLLVVKQGANWVELYFRDGRLMCFGPVRTDTSLGDRLLQDGVITRLALQEALAALGSAQPGETRLALTLMDMGYVSREELRNWGTKKALEVLQALFSWSEGDIYFEDHVQTPPERLLVALSVNVLLPSISIAAASSCASPASVASPPAASQGLARASQAAPVTAPLAPAHSTLSAASLVSLAPQSAFAPLASDKPTPLPPSQSPHMPSRPAVPDVHVANVPTLHDSMLNLLDTAFGSTSQSSTESLLPVFHLADDAFLQEPEPVPPAPVQMLVPPRQIDTSFLGPETVLVPADFYVFRQQNAQVQLSPEHWRLLTRVNGTSQLQMICQELAMPPEMICHLAGELIALGLLQTSGDQQSGELRISGPLRHQIMSGSQAAAADPFAQFSPSSLPFETQSQWGNGGNGAKFIPGRGWITGPQPLQPLESSGPLLASSGSYVTVAGR